MRKEMRILKDYLPAVPMFKMEISPKYEPAFKVAKTVLPSSTTTSKRPLAQIYISLPTSPAKIQKTGQNCVQNTK